MFQWLRRFTRQISTMRGTSISGLSPYEPDPVQRHPAQHFYGSNPWLFITTKRVAQAAAMLPIKVVSSTGTELPENDQAVQFLRNPSPDTMPGHVFWLFMFSWVALKGDAYAFMNFGPGDPMTAAPEGVAPEELLVFPASKVQPLEARETTPRRVLGYRLNDDNTIVDVHESRVLHVRDFSPVSWHQGTGAGEAANTPLSLDDWAQRWNVDGFKHGGSHMRLLFLVKYALQNEKLKERTRQGLQEQFAGVGNSHKPILIDAETDARPFGNTHQDMEFPEMRKMNREEIAAAVGVPPAKIGILEHSNYNNMEQQDLIFWEGTMKPVLALMQSYIDAELLPRLGRRGYHAVFDTREVRVLRENLTQLVSSLVEMINNAMATPNEAIEILRAQGVTELSTFPEGNEHYMNNALVRVADKNEPPETVDSMMQRDQAQREGDANAAIAELITSTANGGNGNAGSDEG